MARRSTQPALYEMMKRRSRSSDSSDLSGDSSAMRPTLRLADDDDVEIMRDDATPSPALERLLQMLQPGQVLRVPIGYVLAGCALVIVLLLVSYMVGVGRGKSIQTAAFHEKFGEGFEISSQRGRVNDPLTLDAMDSPISGAAPVQRDASASTYSNAADGVAASPFSASRPPSQWGPVTPSKDPRQRDWNYFVVAETTMAGGQRLAEFCRSHGLESYALPYKNKCRVIVFPGYQGARDAPEVRALEERIHQIGDKYKAAYKYETNMRDAYPSKYDG